MLAFLLLPAQSLSAQNENNVNDSIRGACVDKDGNRLTGDALKKCQEDGGGDQAADTAEKFFDTDIGRLMVQVARLMAVALGVFAIIKFGLAFFSRNQAGGGLGRAATPALIAFLAAGLLLNLAFTAQLLTWSADLVGRFFRSIGDLLF